MVQPLDVRRIAPTVVRIDLHLIGMESRTERQFRGHHEGSIVDAERFPGGVDGGAGGLAENVRFQKRPVEACGRVCEREVFEDRGWARSDGFLGLRGEKGRGQYSVMDSQLRMDGGR